MNERPADKAVNNLLMLVGIVSLIASIGLGRKSTWSRAAGGTAACSVALFGIVLAFASSDKNTMAGALLIAIVFMTIGALVYLAAHYATSVNEVRESGAESIEQRTP
jgi:multisubunit Na+/H+ antiporter MnhG subunit